MRMEIRHAWASRVAVSFSVLVVATFMPACRTTQPADARPSLDTALADYRGRQTELLAQAGADSQTPGVRCGDGFADTILTLCTFSDQDRVATTQPGSAAPTTRPARTAETNEFVPPDGYWRQDIWHQMGHEAKALGNHDFWKGFKTSFWDLENALVLTATMGASVAIRETGVDDAVRRRTKGHRQLGDADEAIQILGNPGTHFAATGVLWLTTALTKDVKEHELAKTLTQALAVNGVSTMILKAAANTRAPDGVSMAWPSGHTSSAFTVAAVLNEHYGPWVGVPSLALAGLVGYQRLDSRVHDFSDVVFGGMMGYIIGTSIARDNKAEFPELFGMQVIPFVDPETGSSGLALYKSW